jgi:hypothetical protein
VESKRRHLPVLKEPSTGEGEPERPGWQWVGFGALAVFVVWLPLAGLTAAALGAEGARLHPLVAAALFAAGLGVASAAAGFLVGRWGPQKAGGQREAALAGLVAGLAAAMLAWAGAGPAGAVATLAISVPCAALGGRLGLRRRVP